MADLPVTICFKAPVWMLEKLRELGKGEGRTVGNLVRRIIEKALEGATVNST